MNLMKSKQEAGKAGNAAQKELLRGDADAGTTAPSLLRTVSGGIKNVVSLEAKETKTRHITKAYAYRFYTSIFVTPLITVGTLELSKKFLLNSASTVTLQGLGEIIVKPFTYALFERIASHTKLGYVDQDKCKVGEKGKGIVTKKAEEKLFRNFSKAGVYRVYTSFLVTPTITATVLHLRQKYGLSMAETVGMQSLVELAVKPFTYAFFEWVSAHVKLGYAIDGKEKGTAK